MRTAIIEDITENTKTLLNHLQQYEKETGISIHTTSFQNGMDFISDYHPVWDLILLDIEMPLMNGIETARKIRRLDPDVLIIFVTCMAQYAIEGYSVRALDYILKPVHYYSFASKMDQVMEILATRQKKKLIIHARNEHIRLAPEQLLYVEVQNHTLCYHTQQKLLYATGNQSLTRLAAELADCGFARCHQAFLVNLQYVVRYDKNNVWLTNDMIPISRGYYKSFTQSLLTNCSMEGNL